MRVPFADNGLNLIPEGVSDEQALFTGDILSTGYWAAQISEIKREIQCSCWEPALPAFAR